MNDDYERGKRDGVLYCARKLRELATVSQDEFAEAFRFIARAFEENRSVPTPSGASLDSFTCPGVDFGDPH